MEDKKSYYQINDSKKTLVRFEIVENNVSNIEQFNGVDWISVDYIVKAMVEKAVKFKVIDTPAVARKVTDEKEFEKLVAEKIAQVLDANTEQWDVIK